MSTRAGRPHEGWETVVYGLFILTLISAPVIAACNVIWLIDRTVQLIRG